MSGGGKLLKYGIPIINQVSQTGSTPTAAGVRHQTGQCGIDPYVKPPPPPPPMPEKFPDHLLRPPCLPGSEKAKFSKDCGGMQGLYCPPQRIKFKYPPFSENIDFVPSGSVDCWWIRPPVCNYNEEEEDLALKVP